MSLLAPPLPSCRFSGPGPPREVWLGLAPIADQLLPRPVSSVSLLRRERGFGKKPLAGDARGQEGTSSVKDSQPFLRESRVFGLHKPSTRFGLGWVMGPG